LDPFNCKAIFCAELKEVAGTAAEIQYRCGWFKAVFFKEAYLPFQGKGPCCFVNDVDQICGLVGMGNVGFGLIICGQLIRPRSWVGHDKSATQATLEVECFM